MLMHEAHYPGRAPIDAYGNGGFRFAGMSHRGSLLLLPSGIHGWEPGAPPFAPERFTRVFEEAGAIELLLLGTGREIVPAPEVLRQVFREMRIGLEVMNTGAAARTFNVLLAEDRAVGAALVAVD